MGYWIHGRGAELLSQVDMLEGDRVFAGERDHYRAFEARNGRYLFDQAPCELLNQLHRGQLLGYGCRMDVHHATVSASERHPGLIHLKGGGLVMVKGLVSGNILLEGAPAWLDGSHIDGDVTLDHDDLRIANTRINGTLTLCADLARIGPGCRINHLVLRAPERRAGNLAPVVARIELHPGATVERYSVDAPTFELVHVAGQQQQQQQARNARFVYPCIVRPTGPTGPTGSTRPTAPPDGRPPHA
ncbi:hypothetical protein CDL60_05640 [Roseateles noduli]|nr:hypothetical protein CDL60_05640 [Roseateles noduli]